MKIVVIESAGFIGSNISNSLDKAKEHDLVEISRNEADLSKQNSHIDLSKYLTSDCIVVMCAGVKKQLGDNIDIFEKNLIIINNFIRAVISKSPKKIIFFSSASVYGEDVIHTKKITENTSVVNKSFYGMGKYMSELLLTNVCKKLKIELVILRPPLVYGHGDLSFGYGPTGFLRKALDEDEISMWGDGTELREFIYINDVVDIVKILINSEFHGVLNLVSGVSYNYLDITRIIRDILNLDLKVSSRTRSKEKVNNVFSNASIKNVTNDFCFTGLDSGIRMMHESMRQKNK